MFLQAMPDRFFVYRWYSWLMGIIEGRLFEYADLIMVNIEFTCKQLELVSKTTLFCISRPTIPSSDANCAQESLARRVPAL